MAEPPLLSLRDVAITFGGPPIFEQIDLHLVRGERAALVGRNGCGKSPLVKVVVGDLDLDAGDRYVEPGIRIAWLEQEPRFGKGETVRDHVASSGRPDYEVDAILDRLDLDGTRDTATLSGGEARRTALAKVFCAPPDILLLDEPTNHLDLATIEWLERQVLDFKGALLVISHDRTFLTNVTNRVLWLERGVLRRADRGFGHYDEWVEQVLHDEARAAEKLDKQLADETRWLLRGVTARRKRNQGRLRKLETMREARAALIGGRGKAKIELKESELKTRQLIEAKEISLAYETAAGTRTIIDNFSTRILRGDRVGIVGPNGAGKTSLLRMLIGEQDPDGGRIRLAQNVRIAYFDQKRAQLDPDATLQRVLCEAGGDQVIVGGKARHVRAYLKDFLFDPRQADAYVKTLSGGERNRLMLAKILSLPSDLLVLDEPTNDLDMDTLDLLQDLLSDYSGTLLLVSHDRAFLDNVVASTIAVEGDGKAMEYPGGYADYIRQRRPRAEPKPAPAKKPAAAAPPRARTRSQLSFKEQRELEKLPELISALETQIAALEKALSDPNLYTRDPTRAGEAARKLDTAKGQLTRAEDRWLTLEAERERLAS